MVCFLVQVTCSNFDFGMLKTPKLWEDRSPMYRGRCFQEPTDAGINPHTRIDKESECILQLFAIPASFSYFCTAQRSTCEETFVEHSFGKIRRILFAHFCRNSANFFLSCCFSIRFWWKLISIFQETRWKQTHQNFTRFLEISSRTSTLAAIFLTFANLLEIDRGGLPAEKRRAFHTNIPN